MTTEPSAPPPPTLAMLADLVQVALIAWLADQKPKRRKRLQRLFFAIMAGPAPDPEARELNRPYVLGLFVAARDVRRRMRRRLHIEAPL